MTNNDRVLLLDEVASTNSYLMQMATDNRELPALFSVIANSQTAGRGQRGNSWETTPGLNLTFSFLLRSGGLKATEQYAVSELAAYGLLKTIARYLPEDQKRKLKIKWPNDIYYEDRKIAGILIEHSITGEYIDYSVVGIGLNLNETDFPPHLPNPVSLSQITGESYDVQAVHARLMKRYGFMNEEFLLGNYAEVHREYMLRLYRRKGFHPFTDATGRFMAQIQDVLPSGQIVLMREDGTTSIYAFKEVIFDAL